MLTYLPSLFPRRCGWKHIVRRAYCSDHPCHPHLPDGLTRAGFSGGRVGFRRDYATRA